MNLFPNGGKNVRLADFDVVLFSHEILHILPVLNDEAVFYLDETKESDGWK